MSLEALTIMEWAGEVQWLRLEASSHTSSAIIMLKLMLAAGSSVPEAAPSSPSWLRLLSSVRWLRGTTSCCCCCCWA